MAEKEPATTSGGLNFSNCVPSVTATVFIRKLRGKAQAVLVQCSDDKYYIVKMHDNPLGKHVLANEYIGSVLALTCGLSVPNFELVHMSETFIASNQKMWFDDSTGRYPPQAGFHFGSAFMNYEWTRHVGFQITVSDYISPYRVPDIVNRHEFLAMLVLDVFANKTTPRKAIFVGDSLLRAYFVDQGYMLDQIVPPHEDNPAKLLHPERTIYAGLWDSRVVDRQIYQLRTLTELFLTNPLKAIPFEWYSHREAIDPLYFYRRLDDMPQMMRPYEALLDA